MASCCLEENKTFFGYLPLPRMVFFAVKLFWKEILKTKISSLTEITQHEIGHFEGKHKKFYCKL